MNIQRYDCVWQGYGEAHWMEKRSNGVYVKYEDIKHLLEEKVTKKGVVKHPKPIIRADKPKPCGYGNHDIRIIKGEEEGDVTRICIKCKRHPLGFRV